MSKMSFVVGAGIGYVLGTRAGRGQYEKIKKASTSAWQSKPVQGIVHKADESVGDLARNQGAKLTDQVASVVKDKINTVGKKDKPEPYPPQAY